MAVLPILSFFIPMLVRVLEYCTGPGPDDLYIGSSGRVRLLHHRNRILLLHIMVFFALSNESQVLAERDLPAAITSCSPAQDIWFYVLYYYHTCLFTIKYPRIAKMGEMAGCYIISIQPPVLLFARQAI